MKILGIDIGTTTITALLLNAESGIIEKSCTLKNDSFIEGKPFERLQSPEKITEIVKEAINNACDGSSPCAIGISGQMHGILYLDKSNKPCSPLMIWQDERGNEEYKSGLSYAAFLTEKTGIKAASGFGLTTHFYNMVNGLIPQDAVKLSTIHDYLAALLTGEDAITHSSDAASLGFYNLKENKFDEAALEAVGISADFLPEVKKNTVLIGKTNCGFLPDGIPVAVAIGDNQASFLGSVRNTEASILVNVGTGSQISFATKSVSAPCGEIRPLTDDDYIFVGASLCGGRAYAALRDFFIKCADFLGADKDNLYSKMDALSEGFEAIENPLSVNCEFCGTRENPLSRGSVNGIGIDNFTPEHLICGVLGGVADELYSMFKKADSLLTFQPKYLVCSGNGLRKSAVWRKIFENMFSLPCTLPNNSEEASIGACVFAGAAAGIFKDIKASQDALLR